jgi:hypothetical protein
MNVASLSAAAGPSLNPAFAARFWRAFWPRLVLSAVFAGIGFLGPGGDPQAYHVLGRYLSKLWADPVHANLPQIEVEEGSEPLEALYSLHLRNVEAFSRPETVGQYLNTVMPVVFIHALVYELWDHPAAFPLANCILSALAVASASQGFRLSVREQFWLNWNPVSLFYAATHFKESLTESIVLCFTTATFTQTGLWAALFWTAIMALFRLSFAGVFAAILFLERTGIGRCNPWSLSFWVFAGFAVAPDIHAGALDVESGGVFGTICSTSFGRKLLAPAAGMLLPLPFQFLMVRGVVDAWTAFSSVYGVFYYGVWVGIWRTARGLDACSEARRLVNAGLLVSLLMGYLFLGGPGVKDRYFSPFLPLLVLGWLRAKALPYSKARGGEIGLPWGGRCEKTGET